MSSRTHAIHTRLGRSITMLGLAGVAATACSTPVRTAAEPSMSALVVRNTSPFDVNLYAVPTANGKPVWLSTVSAAGTRSLRINASLLHDGNLVIRTQAVGSSQSWTSAPLALGNTIVAALDLVTDQVGNCAGSKLYTVEVRDMSASW